MAKPWFRQKRYGIGLSPASWEGWAVTAAYVLALLGDIEFISRAFADPVVGVLAALVGAMLASAAFFWTLARRSDGDMRWRWGKD